MPGHLDMAFPTANLRPASYNPRAIAPDALEALKSSIDGIGFCKPIIVTKDSLIIAGHQRTKAARALGILAVPAWVLDSVNQSDEVKFNQLHNGTDLDDIDRPVRVPPSVELGFTMVPPADVEGDLRATGAMIRKEIGNLIIAYGNWGGAVANESGMVLSSPQYVLACKLLGIEARVFYVPDDKADLATSFFKKQYGEFSYDHLEKHTYIQTYAQPFRLRDVRKDGVQGRLAEGQPWIMSHLYRLVLPNLDKHPRILDFGCGQADYLKKLRKEGRRVYGIEFFFRKGAHIDPKMVHALIDEACNDMEQNGLFDAVVCDSVVNSVDSVQAEADVMACLNAFCKPGGTIYFSGRLKKWLITNLKARKDTRKQTNIYFPDKNGLTATFRKGSWFYQKFHDREDSAPLALKYINPNPTELFYEEDGHSWRWYGVKTVERPLEEIEGAIGREFNLPWPEGQRVGKVERALAAWRSARSKGG